MQKFQDLLTEAAQLKQEQLKQERKNFEALPEYLKSGLNYAKKYIQLRKQHYLVQKYISQKLKKQGNDHYLLQNYGQALSKYQQALSVFRFIHATKYENLKDEDILYENYMPQAQYKDQHQAHLVALYLNICSALTKMNKKDEAVHSSEEALKLNESNPKIYYKKAQAYLQYINRQSSDIKVGFYYLNKAYELSKDQSILVQMHKIKKELDQQREKQKKWFKFMFDKSKQAKSQDKLQSNETKQNAKPIENNPESKQANKIKQKQNALKNANQKPNQQKKNILDSNVSDFFDEVKASQKDSSEPQISQDQKAIERRKAQNEVKSARMKEQFDRFRQQNENEDEKIVSEVQKLQRTKLSLKPYLIIPRDDRWLIKYQQDFIHKHGSKIYSILQLCNYSDYLIEFKSLLAKCLELKQAKSTAQRDQNKLLQQKISMYQKFVEWIKQHPIEKYKKYIERYELQTVWIQQNRGKPLDQVYTKEPQKKKKTIYTNPGEDRLNDFLNSVRQTNNKAQNIQPKQPKQQPNTSKSNTRLPKTQFVQQMFQKEEQIKKKIEMKRQKVETKTQSTSKNTDNKKDKTYGFKEQWQCTDEDQAPLNGDEVPPNLKGFLQNYQEFPMYQQKLKQMKKEKSKQMKEMRQFPQKQNTPRNMQEEMQNMKENPFGFVKTFLVILAITLLGKLIF